MISKSTATFEISDMNRSLDFYCNVLGFSQRWLWGNPPSFGCIGMGQIEIFLCVAPESARQFEGHMHYFWVEDLETLHQQHVTANAPIIEPLKNKPYGIREYVVRDIDGYHLRFAGPQKYERPKTATDELPPHIRIEVRLPDYETYASLFQSVGWAIHESSMRNALKNTLAGVVAIDTRDGQTVGMVRATGDGKYYSLWDVIVRPSHQGQQIGVAMVQRTLEELRRGGAPPGAFVGLFTGKRGFYEKAGFKKDVGMHMAL